MNANGMQQLIDDYLDGSAGEAEMAQLKAWLEADAANLEVFARGVFSSAITRDTSGRKLRSVFGSVQQSTGK